MNSRIFFLSNSRPYFLKAAARPLSNNPNKAAAYEQRRELGDEAYAG